MVPLPQVLARIAVVVLSSGIALLLATVFSGAPVSFFLCAIKVTVWFGGLWPGLLAIVLSQLAFSYYLAGFAPSASGEMRQASRQLVFGVAGLFVVLIGVAQRKATQSVARARDELDTTLRRTRELWQRTFRAQDDEQRRIARLMHETTGQDLAIIKINLVRFQRATAASSDDDRAIVRESVELTDQAIKSLRTQSYLLYPPLLDDAGLLAAVRWYGRSGFAERSGIAVAFDLPPEFERLPQDIEATLFAVVQEALINIHRRAGSPEATIRVHSCGDLITLQVEDCGPGMPADVLESVTTGSTRALGVGLAGTRERLQQLGGRLEVASSSRGTTIRASVPARLHLHEESHGPAAHPHR